MTTTPATWAHGSAISFTAPGRNVHTVFLHCSASDNRQHDDVSVMRHWHVEGNGWSDVGYHLFIRKNGDTQAGRGLERIPAAQAGNNAGTIAICLHGLKIDRFTAQQFRSVVALCQAIDDAYAGKQIRFRGHTEVSPKSCPVFNYRQVLGLDGRGHMTGTPSYGPTRVTTTRTVPAPHGVIQLLDTGHAVKILQNLLTIHGFEVAADGIFGQETAQAVKAFQRATGLKSDAIVGQRTRAALATGTRRTRALKLRDRGTDVQALQRLLGLDGASLSANGIFGDLTRDGVIAFQKSNRLEDDGIVGARTRAAFLT